MNKPLLTFSLILLISFVPIASANLSNTPWIPPTNANTRITTSNDTVHQMNYSSNYNFVGTGGATITGSNNSKTIYFNVSSSPGSNTQGTYNQTYANNVLINSLGNRINFLNGTNSTVNVVDDPTRNQVNVTISSTGGSGSSGVSSLNALTGALTIACVAGNTTCTTSGGNTITINTAYNIATLNLNEIFSGITTMNNLKLGGQMNINNNSFQSLGHVYTWPNNTGTICLTNQTGSCGPAGSATYDTLVNIGTGEASVYAGNTTKTNFQFKMLKQGSHITLTNNTNDVTISTTGLLSSALLSLNGDTTAAQVVASGNTNHITVTNAGANHSIDIAFKVNNATCSSGYFVSAYSNVTGIYTCSLGNSGTITTASNIGHGGQGFFSSVSGSTIQLRNLTSLRTDLFTIAKNTTDVTLSSSFKSNNITCAAGNAVTSFNNSTGTYTCSPFGSLSSAITSVNSQTGPSINIVCQTGNTTCTNSTNQIKIGFGVNPVITGGTAQTISKQITHSATLVMSGADINLGTNGLTNSGHKSTIPLTTGTLCQTNMTGTCGTNSGVTSITGTAHNVTASSSTGAITLNTGDNVVVTNGATQNFTKLIIHNAGMTMTHSNISLGSNKIITTNFNINDTIVQSLPSILLDPISGNTASIFSFGPSGTSNIVRSKYFRTADITTNFEDFDIGSEINGVSQTYGIKVAAGGTGSLRPWNFYMNTNKLLSFDTTNTITSYFQNIWTPISDPVTAFTNAIWKSSTTADVIKYRNNANTTTYNLVSTLSVTNATTGQLSGNGTGTTSASLVMDGVYATITPANTGRITVSVSGVMKNSISGDGCMLEIRQSTSNMGANGAALAGTILGGWLKTNSTGTGMEVPYAKTYDFSGPVGTKQFFDLAFARITGGTCNIISNNWDLVEH